MFVKKKIVDKKIRICMIKYLFGGFKILPKIKTKNSSNHLKS